MKNEIERRILQGKISLRTAAPGSNSIGTLEGYAAIFNSQSHDLGGFRETLVPGSFDKVLASKPDVRALCNHDASQILGRTKNRTLRLRADNTGLFCSVDLPDTQTARDLHTLISRGDVSQMSFAFKLAGDGSDENWTDASDPDTGAKYALRTVSNVSNLYDVSAVTYPAYENTNVSARALRSHYVILPVHLARPLVSEEDRDWILRETVRKQGELIAADERAAYQSEIDAHNRPHMTPYPWQRRK
jgi:uncharacterized protein